MRIRRGPLCGGSVQFWDLTVRVFSMPQTVIAGLGQSQTGPSWSHQSYRCLARRMWGRSRDHLVVDRCWRYAMAAQQWLHRAAAHQLLIHYIRPRRPDFGLGGLQWIPRFRRAWQRQPDMWDMKSHRGCQVADGFLTPD